MEADIRGCEAALQELRIQYEQYFAGILRRPPLVEEERLRQTIAVLRGRATRGANRFRLENLHQRMLSYQRMWARTVRSIEEGTHRRDVERARKLLGEGRGGEAPDGGGQAPRKGCGDGDPTRPQTDMLDDAKLQRLYRAWMEARKRCNETSRAPSFDQMAASLRKQVPQLVGKHGGKPIDFQVVIREGKTHLRAVVKEPDQK